MNVKAAQFSGFDTIRFECVAQLRAELESFGLPGPPFRLGHFGIQAARRRSPKTKYETLCASSGQ
jgi:hypothetical protein